MFNLRRFELLSMLFVLLFTSCAESAASVSEDEQKQAEKVESFPNEKSFIPEDWEVVIKKTGDLNKDGLEDIVLVIENTASENFKVNDRLGSDTLNLNPRNLLILFQQKEGGFVLGGRNQNGFIPQPNDEDSPCLDDPLLNNGGIQIVKGALKISFNYWLSCGSFFVNTKTFTFRYQNEDFELIGFDQSEYSRASGEETSESFNFSTGKKSTTTGGNFFEDNESNPKTTWSTIEKRKLRLEDCNEETAFNLQQ